MTDVSALYEKYSASVFRFALYLSGDRALAEDITSETFVRAWTSSARIDMTTVKGYLFTIARHLYLRGVRKQSRQVALEDTIQHAGASPYDQAAAKDEFDRVRAGLMTLSEIDRTVLLMRALDDMPYDEIARAVGISLAAVKVKIHRARLALARLRGGDHGSDA
jgi:RNA polymerase sigma-70 factor (ECF subfamily)